VASRLFIDRAATPPHEEGNDPPCQQWTSVCRIIDHTAQGREKLAHIFIRKGANVERGFGVAGNHVASKTAFNDGRRDRCSKIRILGKVGRPEFLLNGRVFQMLIQEGVFRRTDRSEPLEIHASCFIQPHRRLVSTKFRNRGGKMNNRIIDTRHSAYDF